MPYESLEVNRLPHVNIRNAQRAIEACQGHYRALTYMELKGLIHTLPIEQAYAHDADKGIWWKLGHTQTARMGAALFAYPTA